MATKRSSTHSPFFECLTRPHRYPGRLIVFEGIAGSGKTTQLGLVTRWLESLGHHPFLLDWDTPALIQRVTEPASGSATNELRGVGQELTPTTFGLVYAADFAHRLSHTLIPQLKAGRLVLADRYVYTALCQDAVRGCSPAWGRKIYRFAPRPDVVFHLRVPAEVALERIRTSRAEVMDFEAGLDLSLHSDPAESFRIFQGRIGRQFETMIEEFRFTVLNGTAAVGEQQRIVRQVISEKLQGYKAKSA